MARYVTVVLFAVALAVTAGSAHADGPPETIALDPVVFSDVNPCTGETHVVTILWTLRFHDFELTDPARHHGTAKLAGTITTNTGFTGRITQIDLDHGSGPFNQSGSFTATNVANGIARNDSGEAFSVHAVFHVTVLDGYACVVFERFRLECIG